MLMVAIIMVILALILTMAPPSPVKYLSIADYISRGTGHNRTQHTQNKIDIKACG